MSRLIPKVIFHQITECKPNWMCEYSNKFLLLDVALVSEISIRERLFCLTDKEYPIAISVRYQIEQTSLSPGFIVSKSPGVSFTPTYKKGEEYMHYRCQNLELANLFKQRIELKQKIIEKWQQKRERNILDTFKSPDI
jgi:hypothetical protein